MIRLKLKSDTFKSLVNPFFYYFFKVFSKYIKIPQSLSAKYSQKVEERLQKKARERYQNVSKEENEQNNNMVVSITKISQKKKNKSLLSIGKIL